MFPHTEVTCETCGTLSPGYAVQCLRCASTDTVGIREVRGFDRFDRRCRTCEHVFFQGIE